MACGDGRISEDDRKATAHRIISYAAEPQRGQVYRHYKGGFYSIVSVSIMEDTLEVMVTYHSNLKGGDTTRTLKNFTELVDRDGDLGSVPRFVRVAD